MTTVLLDLLALESEYATSVDKLRKQLDELGSITVDSMKMERLMVIIGEIERCRTELNDYETKLKRVRGSIRLEMEGK